MGTQLRIEIFIPIIRTLNLEDNWTFERTLERTTIQFSSLTLQTNLGLLCSFDPLYRVYNIESILSDPIGLDYSPESNLQHFSNVIWSITFLVYIV